MGRLGVSDRSKWQRIAWGTAGAGAIGAAVGLNIAIMRNLQPIRRHTLTMAANWAVFGMLFLTTRELLLAEQAEKNEKLNLRMSQTRDADAMFSSIASGALTGGALSFLVRRTRAAAVSGAVFFAGVSAIGQLAITRVNRYRQQQIILKLGLHPEADTDRSVAHIGDGASATKSWAARLRAKVMVDPISLLPEWFPIRRISSDEYWDMLETRQNELQGEIADIGEALSAMDLREQALLARLHEVESQN